MKSSILRILTLHMVLAVALVSVSAFAGTINVSWTGAASGFGNLSGNWATPGNWSGHTVPNNSDGATYNVTLPTLLPLGDFYGYVVSDANGTIDSLTVDAGANVYTGGGALNVTGNVYVAGSGRDCFDSQSHCGSFSGGLGHVAGTIYNQNGAAFFSAGFTAPDYVQTGAGSWAQISEGSTMNVSDSSINAGQFVMYNTLNGNLAINGGTLDADCFVTGGRCLVNGNLKFSTAGTLATQASVHGPSLPVSGDATLAGTLDLDFSGLPVLPSYEVMTYSSETGQFGTVDATGLNSSERLNLDYGPTALFAVVSTPETSPILLLATGLLALAFAVCVNWRRARVS
ncbi:MAG TPA: hypothetical protein VMI06_16550 [Terriglobia bacterium]|nr:hypothetical protein [Terriglobia bacterium]